MNTARMLTLLLLFICFELLPISAEAVTFTVNSTVDEVDAAPGDGACATAGGACTLRAAIQEANALPGADTIVLKAKIYYLTIFGVYEDASATGDFDITDSLTIKGVSSAQTIINGGALDRVFHIAGPYTVKFVNLSVQNGLSRGDGAGIYNDGGTVSLVSCSVANNISSEGKSVYGGGIYSKGDGSSLKIKSSSVINNAVVSDSQAYGGGIWVGNGGSLNISASKITNNTAISASVQAAGGGIMTLDAAEVTITNSKVLANSAISLGSGNSTGGGIMLFGGRTAAVIEETNISMNSTTANFLALGGGLYLQDETATISSCTISRNRANAPIFSSPTTDGFGGGIAADSSSNITINKASTVVSNLASSDGGGIKNLGSTITVSPNSTVANNMPNDQN